MWRKSYLGEDIGGMSATIVTDFPTDIPTEDELPLLPKQKHKYETLLPWRCTFTIKVKLSSIVHTRMFHRLRFNDMKLNSSVGTRSEPSVLNIDLVGSIGVTIVQIWNKAPKFDQRYILVCRMILEVEPKLWIMITLLIRAN